MKLKKFAIVATALLAVVPVATSLENGMDNNSVVLAKAHHKKTKKARREKKRSKKHVLKLAPFNDGRSNYSFKGWRTIGYNMNGYKAAYGLVKNPGSGNKPFVQLVMINPHTNRVTFLSGAYSVKQILAAPNDRIFALSMRNDAWHLLPSQMKMLKSDIRKD